MFNRRSAIISAFIATAAMALSGNPQAIEAKAKMEADLAAKGLNINQLARQGSKGGPAHVWRTGAAKAKRAARKRRSPQASQRSCPCEQAGMKARQVVGLLFIAACVVIVGMMDKQDAELEQQRYCNNVRDGVWPDYERGRYKDECGGKDPPPFNEDLTK